MGFKAKSKERGVKSDKAGEMLSGFGAEMKSEVGGSHFRFVKLAGNYCYYGEIGEKKIHVVVCICDFVHTMYDYSTRWVYFARNSPSLVCNPPFSLFSVSFGGI